jgi:hypothetical protein
MEILLRCLWQRGDRGISGGTPSGNFMLYAPHYGPFVGRTVHERPVSLALRATRQGAGRSAELRFRKPSTPGYLIYDDEPDIPVRLDEAIAQSKRYKGCTMLWPVCWKENKAESQHLHVIAYQTRVRDVNPCIGQMLEKRRRPAKHAHGLLSVKSCNYQWFL